MTKSIARLAVTVGLICWVVFVYQVGPVKAVPYGQCGGDLMFTGTCNLNPGPDCPDDQANDCDGYCQCMADYGSAHCTGWIGFQCAFVYAEEWEDCNDGWDCEPGQCCSDENYCMQGEGGKPNCYWYYQ